MANMKRGGDFEFDEGGKRSRGDKFEMRVLVPSKVTLETKRSSLMQLLENMECLLSLTVHPCPCCAGGWVGYRERWSQHPEAEVRIQCAGKDLRLNSRLVNNVEKNKTAW